MNPMTDVPSFAGRNVLVTGAANGIGAACAKQAAQAGACVVVTDIDLDGAEECVADIRAAGGEAIALEVDVADDAAVRVAVADAVGEVGSLDVLIHAAGGTAGVRPHPLLELGTEDFQRIVHFNLVGTFAVTQAVARQMVASDPPRKERSIVVIGSLQGVVGSPHLAPYGASKAGIIHLVRTAALELAPYGIRVNAVSPTITDTPSVRAMVDDERRAASEASIPLGRIGTGKDVASVALMLASSAGSFVTGQNVIVDGGLSLTTARPVRR